MMFFLEAKERNRLFVCLFVMFVVMMRFFFCLLRTRVKRGDKNISFVEFNVFLFGRGGGKSVKSNIVCFEQNERFAKIFFK